MKTYTILTHRVGNGSEASPAVNAVSQIPGFYGSTREIEHFGSGIPKVNAVIVEVTTDAEGIDAILADSHHGHDSILHSDDLPCYRLETEVRKQKLQSRLNKLGLTAKEISSMLKDGTREEFAQAIAKRLLQLHGVLK